MSNFLEQTQSIYHEKNLTILNTFGLNYNIDEVPLTYTYDGEIYLSDKKALINSATKKRVGIVGKDYGVTQNYTLADIVNRGVDKLTMDKLNIPELTPKFGGHIKGGAKVYLQFGIKGISKVGNDEILKYITIIDSNDGSTSLSVGIGDFTMSCSNEFYKFHKAGQSKFRHSATIMTRANEISYLIESSLMESMKQVELYQNMEGIQINDELKNRLIFDVLKTANGGERSITTIDDVLRGDLHTVTQNNLDGLKRHIAKEMNQKGHNLWGLHSGVTSWTTHEKSKKDMGAKLVGTSYKYNQKSIQFMERELALV